MRYFTTLATTLIVTLAFLAPAEACTIIAAGQNATADGSVLVSQTDTGQDSRIYVVQGQTHKPGSKAPVYFGIQDATNALEDELGARGVAVMIEAEHMCMSMRGVQKSGASTMTSRFTGIFHDDPAEREKFLSLVRAA